MADMSFTPEQHDALLELVRTELLQIFEQANKRARGGSSNLGTSIADMLVGKGTPTEYLVHVTRERIKKSKVD